MHIVKAPLTLKQKSTEVMISTEIDLKTEILLE